MRNPSPLTVRIVGLPAGRRSSAFGPSRPVTCCRRCPFAEVERKQLSARRIHVVDPTQTIEPAQFNSGPGGEADGFRLRRQLSKVQRTSVQHGAMRAHDPKQQSAHAASLAGCRTLGRECMVRLRVTRLISKRANLVSCINAESVLPLKADTALQWRLADLVAERD